MNKPLHQEASKILENYKEIKEPSYVSTIRFYEAHERDIAQLPLHENVFLLNEYIQAIFELGRYEKYIHKSQALIILTIEHNISLFEGEDIYYNALIKLAASYYHIMQTDNAMKVAVQLVSMDPSNKPAKYILEKCYQRQHRNVTNITRLTMIVGFLTAASIVAVELFIIKPFYSKYESTIELIRNYFFVISIVVTLLGELVQWSLVKYFMYRSIKNMKSIQNKVNSK